LKEGEHNDIYPKRQNSINKLTEQAIVHHCSCNARG